MYRKIILDIMNQYVIAKNKSEQNVRADVSNLPSEVGTTWRVWAGLTGGEDLLQVVSGIRVP